MNLNLSYLQIEQHENRINIVCDRQNESTIRHALNKLNLDVTDSETLVFSNPPDGNPLRDLVGFDILTTNQADVLFALADSCKSTRPYARETPFNSTVIKNPSE